MSSPPPGGQGPRSSYIPSSSELPYFPSGWGLQESAQWNQVWPVPYSCGLFFPSSLPARTLCSCSNPGLGGVGGSSGKANVKSQEGLANPSWPCFPRLRAKARA